MPWKCEGATLYIKKGGKWRAQSREESHEACERKKRFLYAQEENGGLARKTKRTKRRGG